MRRECSWVNSASELCEGEGKVGGWKRPSGRLEKGKGGQNRTNKEP